MAGKTKKPGGVQRAGGSRVRKGKTTTPSRGARKAETRKRVSKGSKSNKIIGSKKGKKSGGSKPAATAAANRFNRTFKGKRGALKLKAAVKRYNKGRKPNKRIRIVRGRATFKSKSKLKQKVKALTRRRVRPKSKKK